jgi:hypothetical protein
MLGYGFRRTHVGVKHLAEAQVDIPGLISKCFTRIPRSNMIQQMRVQADLCFYRKIFTRNKDRHKIQSVGMNPFGKSGKAFGEQAWNNR